MTVKEVKMFEVGGYKFDTYEDAVKYENIIELCKIFKLNDKYEKISIDQLYDNKDKLIKFFVDKGYVKEIKIGVNNDTGTY